MASRAIPSYELYGELLSGSNSDPVHHEMIRERSILHDWTIRLHRHKSLAQLFLFRTPGVCFQIEEVSHRTTEEHVLFVPPGVVHGFRFDEDVDGHVLSIRVDGLTPAAKNLLAHPVLRAGGILTHAKSENFEHIAVLFAQMEEIFHKLKVERAEVLTAITELLIAYISGDMRRENMIAAVGHTEKMTRHERQAEDFCSLVEKNFAQNLSVEDYARKIGVSAPHLTRVCRSILGYPPNELVRQRRLLEAKRLLEYTRLSVSEVSHHSGFRDPSFFSRTFQKSVGVSPRVYREHKDQD